MNQVGENCRRILDRIRETAIRCNRDPESIRLIAVTKTVSAAHIRQSAEAGIINIGENRLQEALGKREELRHLPLTWHFIGKLQSNKVRKIVENFDWIQSVDRAELCKGLNEYATVPTPVLIEVKLADERSKAGVAPEELAALALQFKQYERLQLRGLFAVPPFSEDPENSRPYFARLRELAESLALRELSMGMSNDFEVAIQEGATMLRIGTAIFGARR